MQARNKRTTIKLGSIVLTSILLSSCGAGTGDQNSVPNLPEVAQATQAPTQAIAPTPIPSAPTQQVTTDNNNETAGIPTGAEQTTGTEAEQIPVVVPEVESETAAGTNTTTDFDSDGVQVVDIGIGIPVEPEIIVIEETLNETTGDVTGSGDNPDEIETPEQATDETPEETPVDTPDETPNETTDESSEVEPNEPATDPTEPDAESEQPTETITDTSEPLINVACTASQADIQTSTLQLINEARAVERMCGGVLFEATAPLTWNTKLQDAALVHSLDMSQNDFFSHDGSDGSTASQRADAQQFDWRSIGENIAAGQQTTELVIQAWLDSPGHCANLMNPKFKETAVVCVEDLDAQYRQYWTNVLGTSF